MKLLVSALASALFLIVLIVVYLIHVRFLSVDVVLYSAIADAAIATVLGAALLFGFRWFDVLSVFERLQLTVIWMLVGYSLAISIPAVIDRSLSFYILEKIEQRGGGIQLARFEEVFTKEYVKEHRLVDVRLTEQLESKTIVVVDGCVRLTERGRRLAHFGRSFRQGFLPRSRLLMGEYTDELTDPFRKGVAVPDYAC